MGCHHDRGAVYGGTNTEPCPTSGYTYGFKGTTSAYPILAYNCKTTQCDNNPYTSCTRLPFFSNPNLAFDGKDMGNSGTDNARVINENAQAIANLGGCTSVNSKGECNGYTGICEWIGNPNSGSCSSLGGGGGGGGGGGCPVCGDGSPCCPENGTCEDSGKKNSRTCV